MAIVTAARWGVGLLGLLAACSDEVAPRAGSDGGMPIADVDAGILSCQAADALFVTQLYGDPSLIALRACTVDSDCTALTSTLQCPEPQAHRFEYCDTAIALTNLQAGTAWLDQAARDICPRILVTPNICGSISDCNALRPRCLDQVCSRSPNNLADDGGLVR